MPIYTFKCSSCNKTFDKMFSKPEPPRTEKCECGDNAKKIITPIKFRCLGLGFAGNEIMRDKLLLEYNDIADNAYMRKAELSAPSESESDAAWQNLANVVGD